MRCTNCGAELPFAAAFENLTSGATKLGPNDFLTRTPRGNLLRVRLLYLRHDSEAGTDAFKVQVAPAQDETGDVAKGLDGENIIYPAYPLTILSSSLQKGADGRPLLSLTGVLADVVAKVINDAEASLYAHQHLAMVFGKPTEQLPASPASAEVDTSAGSGADADAPTT